MHTLEHTHVEEIINRQKELKELYLSLLLRTFAISMVVIFVPIYLLIQGFTLSEVLIFYIFFEIAAIILSPVSAVISSKIGVKHTLLLSAPVTILYFLSLNFLSTFNIPLYLISIIGATVVSLYWIPLNSDFAKSSDKKHRGRQSAYLYTALRIGSIAGPILGALIAQTFGFSVLFVVISLIILASTIPPLSSNDYKSKIKYDWQKFLKKESKYSKQFFFKGILNATIKIIFPIYIFFTLNDVLSLGEIGSMLALGTLVFTILIGRLSDRIGKSFLITIGGFVLALAWLVGLSATTLYMLVIVAIILGIGGAFIDPVLFAYESNKARSAPTEFMTLREMLHRLGIGFVMLVMLLTGGNIQIVFVIALISAGYFILKKF